MVHTMVYIVAQCVDGEPSDYLHIASCFVLRASCFVLRASCFVLRASCFVLRAPYFVLRASCSVLHTCTCTPYFILVLRTSYLYLYSTLWTVNID
jgi:hypothetical protein